jgi:hypothetical protein
LFEGSDQPLKRWPCSFENVLGQVLVRKIDGRLKNAQGLDQVPTPDLVGAPQGPTDLLKGLDPLGLGLGLYKVGNPFGLGQVKLTVLEGPPGEFSGLGQSESRPVQGLYHRSHHRGTAMQKELGRIFACITTGTWHPEHQGLVEGSSVGGL